MSQPAPSLKGRALRYLSRREHSRAELQRKLAAFEDEPGSLTRVLDELQAAGFISEQRVVESVLHQRAARLGNLRLKQELERKGLESGLIQSALADLQGSEFDRAKSVWQKKFGQYPEEPADYARQARFLQARGFSSEVVRRVLKDPA